MLYLLSQLAGILSNTAKLFQLGQEKGFLDASTTTAVNQHRQLCVQPPPSLLELRAVSGQRSDLHMGEFSFPKDGYLNAGQEGGPGHPTSASQSIPAIPPSLISSHTSSHARRPRVGTSCSFYLVMSPNLRFLVQGLFSGGLKGKLVSVLGEQGTGSV